MTTPSGLWAEGDSLSPTNLNRRNPVGTFPAKIYHAAWAAGTGTTQITNAIANAAAGGYNAVFVDASRLPYDANAVTFNTNVRMIREGGLTAIDEVDVKAFGAAGNNATDDYYALAAAHAFINANVNQDTSPHVLRIPPGRYLHSKPLIAGTGGFRIVGPSSGITGQVSRGGAGQIVSTYQGGPQIIVCNVSATVNGLVTALATGTGQAWTDIHASFPYFNLRDLAFLDLNGTAQFCVELFYSSTFANTGSIISSKGKWLQNDPKTTAFDLRNNNGPCQFVLQLSTTGTVTLSGGTINDGTTHHLAGTYDGTTVRLFVDGVLVASQAGSGTIVQGFAENVILGRNFEDPTEQLPDVSFFGPNGTVDSVRISSTARYTTGFTKPTAKFAADGQTLALLNFDQQIGPSTRVQTKQGDAWAVQRVGAQATTCDTFSADGVEFLSTNGAQTCIFFQGIGPHWKINNCQIGFCRNGIMAPRNDNFNWSVRDSAFGGTRYGILTGSNAGLAKMDTVWFASFGVPCMLSSNVELHNVFCNLDTRSLSGFNFFCYGPDGAPTIMDNCWTNTESGSNTSFRAPVMAGGGAGLGQGPGGISMRGCGIDSTSTYPHIIADGFLMQITAQDCNFITHSASNVIQRLGTVAPVHPWTLRNCAQSGTTWIPWADHAGDVVVFQPGKGAAIATTSTQTFNASQHDKFESTLTADVSASTLINVTPGQELNWLIKQDSTGSRLWTIPSAITWGTVGAVSIYTAANGWNQIDTVVDLSGNAYVRSFRTGP